MSRLVMALGGVTMLGAACATAAEPMQLTDNQLDTVTAGAIAGARISALAFTVPTGSARAFAVTEGFGSGYHEAFANVGVNEFGAPRADAQGNLIQQTNFGPDDSDGGISDAIIGGNLYVIDGPLFTSAIGIFSSRVGVWDCCPNAVAQVEAEALTSGGTPVINQVLVVELPNNNGVDAMFATLAAVLH